MSTISNLGEGIMNEPFVLDDRPTPRTVMVLSQTMSAGASTASCPTFLANCVERGSAGRNFEKRWSRS